MMTQTYFYDSMQSIVVTWAQRAQNFFWSHNGTQEEMERQGSLVGKFGADNVNGATAAEVM
jgi:hypothetical protein